MSGRRAGRETETARSASLLADAGADLHLAIVVVRPDGLIAAANQSAAELFGYGADELASMPVDRLIPAGLREGHAAFRAAFARAPTNRPMGTGRELLAVRRDGTTFPVEVALSARETGEGLRITALVTDITARVAAEHALRESEERNRVLVEYATEAITVLDVEQERWVDVNQRAVELFGLPREELLTRHPAELSPPTLPDGRDAAAAAAAHIARAAAGETIAFDWTHRNGAGEDIPCEVRMVRLPAAGRTLLRGAITDLSDRLRQQRALEESRDLLERAQRLASLGTWTRRPGRPAEISPGLQRVLGFDRDTIATVEDGLVLVHPDDRASVAELLAEAAATGGPVDLQYRVLRPGAPARWVRSVVEALPGEAGTLVGVVQDIDEWRRAEDERRQMQKMEAVGQLAGGIAHDFNNMLTGILGFAELTLALDIPEKARAHVTQIMTAAQRAAHLTAQLLAFGRRQVLSPRPIDLNDEITLMLPLLDRLIPETIEVVAALEEGLPAIYADPSQMHQVVLNLAINARDAMPRGGRITIATRTAGAPGVSPRVQLTVADEGAGMDEGTRARIFEPFFTTKAVGEGTGMGLATVNGIIEQTGGTIEVETSPGQGSEFRIELAAISERARPAAVAADPAEVAPGAMQRILVVDDDATVRELIADILGFNGYLVIEARDAAAAIGDVTAHGPPSLLLTDLVMPGMNGRELAAWLHERHPGIPVVFSSGYDEQAPALPEAGTYSLAKPYVPSALLRTVARALAEHRA